MRSTRWALGLALAGLVGVPAGTLLFDVARAADSGGQAPPVKLTKEEDHQRLMDLLHMTEIRRGRDGTNKESPFLPGVVLVTCQVTLGVTLGKRP